MAAFGASSERKVDSILIVIAMEAEARPFLALMGLQPAGPLGAAPCELYQGIYSGCNVAVVTNGKCSVNGVDNVGTTPAALAAFVAINHFKPTLIINAGTAGGFKARGALIGDPFVSTAFRHHDRRIPIPGFEAYGKGNHASHPVPNLIKQLGFKCGVVTTGNSLDYTDMDVKIMLENEASVKDMEGAAIAWIAALSQTPLIALKVVTDIVDGDRPSHEVRREGITLAPHARLTCTSIYAGVYGEPRHGSAVPAECSSPRARLCHRQVSA